MNTLIEIKNLHKVFDSAQGKIEALSDINLTINDGEIFGIIGLSGAGKSTLVRCINLLEQPSEGSVILDGKDLTQLPKNQLLLTRRNIGMIFQGFNLLSQRNVLKNVCYPMEIAGYKKADAVKRALELIEMVGLSDRIKSYPSQLSGGQKQRVAIARALATNPKYLLCDEATSALDPNTVRSILALLKDINKKMGVTIIVITHEMKVVEQICDRVAVIDGGHVVEVGDVKQVFISPKSKMARELVLPKSKTVDELQSERVIRIVFDGQNANEPVVSNITVECRCAVNILGADTKQIDGKAFGQMILGLPNDTSSAERVKNYLVSRNIPFEEVSDI